MALSFSTELHVYVHVYVYTEFPHCPAEMHHLCSLQNGLEEQRR